MKTENNLDNTWIESSYDNLPNKHCRVYVCVDGIPQKRSREFWINGDSKNIRCGRNTGEITHFKIKA